MGTIISRNTYVSTKPGNPLDVATGELVIGRDYDTISATYPTTTQEVYTYTLSAATVLVVQVNYVTSDKKDILSVVVL